MTTCNCSIDVRDYDAPVCCTTVMRTARKAHRCCECHRDIAPGDRYEEITGVWDGRPDRFRTCVSCKFLRDTYCPDGTMYGGLFEQIEECVRELKYEMNRTGGLDDAG